MALDHHEPSSDLRAGPQPTVTAIVPARNEAPCIAAVVHGLFPFLFRTTGSRITRELNDVLEQSRARQATRPTRNPL